MSVAGLNREPPDDHHATGVSDNSDGSDSHDEITAAEARTEVLRNLRLLRHRREERVKNVPPVLRQPQGELKLDPLFCLLIQSSTVKKSGPAWGAGSAAFPRVSSTVPKFQEPRLNQTPPPPASLRPPINAVCFLSNLVQGSSL